MSNRTNPLAEQRELLRQAREAAAAGALETMLACLHSSAVLDGLYRHCAKSHRGAPPSVIERAIAKAVEALQAEAYSGQRIDNPGAFLWKVCERRMTDAMRARPPRVVGLEDHDVAPEGRAVSEDRLREAVKEARSLLPLIRGERQREFIEVHLDAIENGIYFTSDEELADILGTTPGNVQVIRHRAFSRWRRLAQEKGLLRAVDSLVVEGSTAEQEEDEDDE